MDKKIREFLISNVESSLSNIGYALRILLTDEDTSENSIKTAVPPAVPTLKQIEAEEKKAEGEETIKAEKPVSPKSKRSQGTKSAKATEEAKKEVEEEKAPETAEVVKPEAEQKEETKAEAPVAVTAPETPVKEEKSKEELLKALKDDMTALALKGKGDAIQKGLADYSIRKISEVKTEDYDDFRTRVYYYAGELEVENA